MSDQKCSVRDYIPEPINYGEVFYSGDSFIGYVIIMLLSKLESPFSISNFIDSNSKTSEEYKHLSEVISELCNQGYLMPAFNKPSGWYHITQKGQLFYSIEHTRHKEDGRIN